MYPEFQYTDILDNNYPMLLLLHIKGHILTTQRTSIRVKLSYRKRPAGTVGYCLCYTQI